MDSQLQYYIRKRGETTGPHSAHEMLRRYDFGELKDLTTIGAGFEGEGVDPDSYVDLKDSNLYQKFGALREEASAGIVLTTEVATDLPVTERLDIITAECAFGMNLIRDAFANVRDVFGGRSGSTQKVLRDARKTVLTELRKEAYFVKADAVIAVDLDYSEFSGAGKTMLFVVASGTAVRLRQE